MKPIENEKPPLHHGIKCLTCQVMIFSKKELPKRHRGHTVVYLDKDGNPEL